MAADTPPFFERVPIGRDPDPTVPARLVALRSENGKWDPAEIMWREWDRAFNGEYARLPLAVVLCRPCGRRIGRVRDVNNVLVLGTTDGHSHGFTVFRALQILDAASPWVDAAAVRRASHPGDAGVCPLHMDRDGVAQVRQILSRTPPSPGKKPRRIEI